MNQPKDYFFLLCYDFTLTLQLTQTVLYLLDSNLSNYKLLPLCLFQNEHSAFMGLCSN